VAKLQLHPAVLAAAKPQLHLPVVATASALKRFSKRTVASLGDAMKISAKVHAEIVTKAASFIAVTTVAVAGLQAQTVGQKAFASSKDAVAGFIQATRAGDAAALQSILGSGRDALISSGDSVADKAARNGFLAKYDAKHSLVVAGPNQMTLAVGADDWPLPIPLVNNGGKWYFDGAAGQQEIVYRRIGNNELSAIKVCRGVVDAERDYAAISHDGRPAGAYAERIVSNPASRMDSTGRRNRVSRPARPETCSPMRAWKAINTPANRRSTTATSMLSNLGGFAFIAYPAQYRASGVMTFVVTHDGVILEKDLGPQTGEIVGKIGQYQVDNTWKQVE